VVGVAGPAGPLGQLTEHPAAARAKLARWARPRRVRSVTQIRPGMNHASACHFSGDGGLTPPTPVLGQGGQVARPWPCRRVGATPGFSGEKAACRRPGGQKARSRTVLSERIERSKGHKRPCHGRSCALGNGRSAARNLRRRPDCSGRQGTGRGLERPLVFRTEV